MKVEGREAVLLSSCTFWVVFWPFLLLPLVGLPAAVGFFYVTTIVSVLCLKPTAPCHAHMSRGPMKASAHGAGGQQSEIRTVWVDIVMVLCRKEGVEATQRDGYPTSVAVKKELLHRQLWWKCVGRSGLGVSNVPRRLTSGPQLILLLPNQSSLQFDSTTHPNVPVRTSISGEELRAYTCPLGPSTVTNIASRDGTRGLIRFRRSWQGPLRPNDFTVFHWSLEVFFRATQHQSTVYFSSLPRFSHLFSSPQHHHHAPLA